MQNTQYNITARVWLYEGKGAWHFVTIPQDISRDITFLFGEKKRGWGSLPVEVMLGSSTWKTSIFPDKKEDAYLLPLKALIRKKEAIHVGDTLLLALHFL